MPTVTESWCPSSRDQEEGRGPWGTAWKARLPSPIPGLQILLRKMGFQVKRVRSISSSCGPSESPQVARGCVCSTCHLMRRAMNVGQDRISGAVWTRFCKLLVTRNHSCAHHTSVPAEPGGSLGIPLKMPLRLPRPVGL